MKIIQHGTEYRINEDPGDGIPFKGECFSCDCKVEANWSEIVDKSGRNKWTTVCPECGWDISISDSRLGTPKYGIFDMIGSFLTGLAVPPYFHY